MNGLWIFDGNHPQSIKDALAALNARLLGWRFVYFEVNTDAEPHALPRVTHSYMSSHHPIRLDGRGDNRFIQFVSGPAVSIRVDPLVFDGQAFCGSVEISGEHVTIATPYLFHERPWRVDWHYYGLSVTSRL